MVGFFSLQQSRLKFSYLAVFCDFWLDHSFFLFLSLFCTINGESIDRFYGDGVRNTYFFTTNELYVLQILRNIPTHTSRLPTIPSAEATLSYQSPSIAYICCCMMNHHFNAQRYHYVSSSLPPTQAPDHRRAQKQKHTAIQTQSLPCSQRSNRWNKSRRRGEDGSEEDGLELHGYYLCV